MEIGGFFLLVIVIVVLGVLGGGVYVIAARLRQKQLGPAGDEVEGPRGPRDAASQRPEHVEVESEQQSDFVGTR